MTVTIDRLVRTRRKTLAIIVELDGTVTVRAPLKLEQAQIDLFVQQKENWIRKKQAQAHKLPPVAKKKHYVDGETFLFMGASYPLVITAHQAEALLFDGARFSLKKSRVRSGKALFTAWYQEHARDVITRQANEYAHKHGFRFTNLRVGSARTRWGSCSGKDSLNFTWRLVMAPPEIITYVIIHELAHTRHKNHSAQFWAEVAVHDPDYRAHRKWLKTNGGLLDL